MGTRVKQLHGKEEKKTL